MISRASSVITSRRKGYAATQTPNTIHPDRRSMLLGGSVLSLAFLAGCSSSPGSDESRDAGPAATASAKPSRVAALEPFSAYNLFDLGVVPVAAQAGLESALNPRYSSEYAEVPSSGTWDEPDLEAVALSKPDLILMSDAQSDYKAEMEQIATVVVVTSATSATWETAAEEVAEAIGETEKLKQLRDAYEKKASDIRHRYSQVLDAYRWASVWLGTDNGFSLRPQQSNGGVVLAEAGIRFSPSTEQLREPKDRNVSWEEASLLDDADVICLPGMADGSDNAQTDAILDNAMFDRLPAAQSDRVFVFDFLTPGSYVSATQLLDEIDAALKTLST